MKTSNIPAQTSLDEHGISDDLYWILQQNQAHINKPIKVFFMTSRKLQAGEFDQGWS